MSAEDFSRLRVPRGIRIRIVSGYLAVIVLLGAGWSVSALSTHRVTSHFQQAISVDDALLQNVATRLRFLDDEETGVRGYLLTHDSAFLAPYRAAQRVVTGLRHNGDNLAREAGPRILAMSQRMSRRAIQWEAWAAGVLRDPGAVSPRTPASIAQQVRGKALFDGFRTSAATLTIAMESERSAELRQSSSIETGMNRLLASIFLFAVGLVVLVAWLTSRAVTRPLGRLREAAETIRKGNLTEPIQVQGSEEFVGLGQAMDRMRAERRAAEESLRRSELRFRSVASSANDAIIVIDGEGKIRSWNHAATRIFGYGEEEIVGQPLAILMPERMRRIHIRGLERYRDTKKARVIGQTFDATALRKDGSEFLMELSVNAWTEGEENYLCGIIRDVTQRKQEEDLLQLGEARLRRANAELEQAVRVKSEFLATMSHEIRTPMNGVIGMTGLLLDTELNPEQRDYAETVRYSGEALLTLINDILDFSKVEAGRLELELHDFEPRRIVEEVVELLSPQARGKGLELGALVEHDVPRTVRGDAARLRQILLNLIGNALKFTHTGSISVRMELDVAAHGDLVLRASVTDTGIGIPIDAQGQIFDLFSQADASTTRRYGGTGLGLAITKRLVELMGGEIEMTSEPGEGSCFAFTARVVLGTAESRELTGPNELAGLRALIVDDNEVNRVIVRHHLLAWEMDCDEARDGMSALTGLRNAAAAGRPFDIAILDMDMPGMDGVQLAERIKSTRSLASTKLIMLASIRPFAAAGSDPERHFETWLMKPFREVHLWQALLAIARSEHPEKTPIVDEGLRSATSDPPGPDLDPSSRVLIAEDNPVSQRIVVLTLKKLGLSVDVASDGREAVAASARTPYDLILMDCQMPAMDGFEATAAIRSRELGSGVHVPIVALTANAVLGDEARCFAAGMDGYLTKPLAPNKLRDALRRWLPASPQSVQLPATDGSVLEGLRTLQGEGESDIVREIVGMYLAHMPGYVDGMKSALEGGDSQRLYEVAHSLKGSSRNVGASRLAAVSAALEEYGREGKIEEARSLVGELEGAAQCTSDELSAAI